MHPQCVAVERDDVSVVPQLVSELHLRSALGLVMSLPGSGRLSDRQSCLPACQLEALALASLKRRAAQVLSSWQANALASGGIDLSQCPRSCVECALNAFPGKWLQWQLFSATP